MISTRDGSGLYMVEVVIASTISMVLVGGVLSITSALYRSGSQNQNQILAATMAQEVVDNARNSSYSKLQSFLNGQTSASEQLSLYDYPSDPAASMFPRPLLRNTADSGLHYQDSSLTSLFNGTVTETLTDLTPGNTTNSLTGVKVDIQWKDGTGPHQYVVETQISQSGVHS